MNFKFYHQIIYAFLIAFLAISLVTAKKGGKKRKAKANVISNESFSILADNSVASATAAATDSGTGPTENQLGDVYKKMGGVTDGMSMNLDSSFGAGRCNCVCEDH